MFEVWRHFKWNANMHFNLMSVITVLIDKSIENEVFLLFFYWRGVEKKGHNICLWPLQKKDRSSFVSL
jgi:hypothetical protein